MAITDNIQAYFKFNESSGNAADSTANANTLTNNATATFTAGKLNNALTLASASSQFMSRTSASCVGIDFNATDFSINCWVNFTTLPSSSVMNICGKFESTNRQYEFALYSPSAGVYHLIATIGLGADTADQQDVVWTPSTGTWYMVTFRYTNATTKGDFSVNGSAQGAQVTFANALASDVSDFRVGKEFTGNFMNGQIDELGLWNRRITDAEITSLYNGGAGLSYPFTSTIGPFPTHLRG